MADTSSRMRVYTIVVLVAVAATLALAAGSCSVRDPLFCDPTHPCTDPARPYCDTTGDYDPDHIRNSCVPDPFGPPDARPDATPSDAPISPAMLTINESTHDFNGVLMGSESLPVQFIVTNDGQMTSGQIGVSIGGTNQAAFIIVPTGDSSDCNGQTLAPTATCIVQVKYRPDAAGAETASLHIDASPGGMKIVGLTGEGLVPGSLEVTVPASGNVSFASTPVQSMTASQTITIHNKGGVPCTTLVVTLNDTTNYTKTSTTCGTSLASNATCDIDVRFNPTTVGSHPSSVTVISDQGAVTPQLQGTGTAMVTVTKTGTGAVTDTLASPIISCGTTCSGTYGQTPITLHASTSGGIPFDSWGGACASAGSNPDCTLALTQPTQTVSATFGVCAPGTGMCASGMLQTCDSTGHWGAPSTCTLGCFTDGTRCYDVKPSNGIAAELDDAKTQPAFSLMSGAQFDTSAGKVTDGDGSPVPIKWVAVHQANGAPDITVFEVGSLTASSFTVTGSPAFAIVSNGDVSITGLVAGVVTSGYISPGAIQFGDPCSGVYIATGNKTRMAGTGGGSFATTGGRGGNNAPSLGSAAGTAPLFSTPLEELTPLRGGCTGGYQFDSGAQYGAGGGAIQIVSRTSIKLTGSGVISMGGAGAPDTLGGGGGGTGGAILLEAPSVVLNGGSAGLAVNGGGGGARCAAGKGDDGKPSVAVAHGGVCTGTTVTNGGNGATSSSGATQGVDFATGTDNGVAGGGGGGLGIIRVNTSTGFTKVNGAFVSGSESEGSLGLR
jgi:hypothetical protein